MLVLTFLLAAFLDIAHPMIAVDGLERQFVVSEITDSALSGCAANPQNGGVGSIPLIVGWMPTPELTAEISQASAWLAFEMALTDPGGIQPMVALPSGGHPPPLPISATPEPPTFAILGITAATLLFLLFGHRSHRRPGRHC